MPCKNREVFFHLKKYAVIVANNVTNNVLNININARIKTFIAKSMGTIKGIINVIKRANKIIPTTVQNIIVGK